MRNVELERIINEKLSTATFQDYAPNGLQVEGRAEVKRIVTGVTASQALLDAAVEKQADAILVHHGYFWKNEPQIVCGMKRNRLKTLLLNDINLYGYHLPLDAHPELGNNAQLAALLEIQVQGAIEPLVPYGELAQPMTADAFCRRVEKRLGRSVLHCGDNAPQQIQRVAWCTGGGQGFIEQAARFGSMRLLPVKCLSKRSISRVRWGCISLLPDTMPPNAVASKRWANGWRHSMVLM